VSRFARLVRPLAALSLIGAVVSVPTVVASAAEKPQPGLGIRLLEAPTALRDDPRAHVFVIDHLQPGTTITRKFEVSDGTKSPLDVTLYSGGATIEDGVWSGFDGRTPNELSQWTTVSPQRLHLEPGTAATAELTVQVPRDAPAAERYAVVWAQAEMPTSGPVTEVARVGIREYISVGVGGGPAADFTIDTLTAERDPDGRPVVQAQVHNTGGRAIDLSGSLRMRAADGGLAAGPFPAELGTTLAPGQSEPVTILLDESLPAGPWKARLALRSGLLKRAAEGVITFPDAAGTSASPVVATPVTSGTNLLLPIAIGLGIALLLALLLFLLWRRRRRKDDDEQTPAGGPTPELPAQRAVPEPERTPEPAHDAAAVREPAPAVRAAVRKPARAPAGKAVREPARDAGEDAVNRLRRRQ
jgi:LPXTG-motif cell wall-anchored protein